MGRGLGSIAALPALFLRSPPAPAQKVRTCSRILPGGPTPDALARSPPARAPTSSRVRIGADRRAHHAYLLAVGKLVAGSRRPPGGAHPLHTAHLSAVLDERYTRSRLHGVQASGAVASHAPPSTDRGMFGESIHCDFTRVAATCSISRRVVRFARRVARGRAPSRRLGWKR